MEQQIITDPGQPRRGKGLSLGRFPAAPIRAHLACRRRGGVSRISSPSRVIKKLVHIGSPLLILRSLGADTQSPILGFVRRIFDGMHVVVRTTEWKGRNKTWNPCRLTVAARPAGSLVPAQPSKITLPEALPKKLP